MSRRLLTGTALGGTLVLSLTGCLGSSGSSAGGGSGGGGGAGAGGGVGLAAASVIQQASQKTSGVSTVSVDISSDGTSAQGAVHSHITGEIRLRPTLAESLTMDGMNVGGRSVPSSKLLLIGDTIYMKNAAFSALGGGKTWIKISLTKVGNLGGLNFDALLKQAQQNGPAEQTKILTASKDIKKVGTETVGGIATTHYAGTVSVAEAMGTLSGEARSTLQQIYKAVGTNTITFDIWVDGNSLPRKQVSKFTTTQGPMTTTMLYTAYNQPFHAQVPPAALVGTFPSTGN